MVLKMKDIKRLTAEIKQPEILYKDTLLMLIRENSK